METIKKFKVTELKKILETHNLPLHGRKDDLVERVFELTTKENKTVEQLLADEEKENDVKVEVNDEMKTADVPENDLNKEQVWHTEYLERKQRIVKFGGEPSELDLKIERMMRFGTLTKDDPDSKFKPKPNKPKSNKNSNRQRSGKFINSSGSNARKSKPY
eukprot:NODE_100_length_20777_cov_0.240884.p11 type:complete len:161 gc:universal NODE_100_length_20777_cov_0.240884:17648-17166(-)